MRRSHHRNQPARLPPALRCFAPKLKPSVITELQLAHLLELDTLAKGQSTADTLWGWAGGVLAWSRVAEDLQRGVDEMAQLLNLAGTVLERFKRTGSTLLMPTEYEQARRGVEVMDALAEMVDHETANRAVNWATAAINALRSDHDQRKAA